MKANPEIQEVAAAVRRQSGDEPFELAVVLGSGLGTLAEQMEPSYNFV